MVGSYRPCMACNCLLCMECPIYALYGKCRNLRKYQYDIKFKETIRARIGCAPMNTIGHAWSIASNHA